MSRKNRRVNAKLQKAMKRPDGPAVAPAALPPDPLFTQAVAAHQAGRAHEAEALYRQVVTRQPSHIRAWNNLGIALRQMGRMEDALEVYRKVAALSPEFPDTYYNMGVAFQKMGRMEEAAAAYARCVALKPDHVLAISNHGVVLGALGHHGKAVACYRQALAVKPDHWEAYINLGGALERMGALSQAEAALRRALELNPTAPELYSNLGNVLKSRGLLEEANLAYRQGLNHAPDFVEIHCNLLFATNYQSTLTPEAVFRLHTEWAERFERPWLAADTRSLHANRPDPERRLRIGYVSPDLKTHSVAYFFEPLLKAHDRSRFEIICYAQVTEPDKITDRLRGLSDGWHSTVGMSDDAMAARIRADGIDVLVDLAGHTGNNRLPVFARRPAPVQLTWLGYPNTTGMRTMGYRITDAIADQTGVADALHTEILARLPHGFLCYTPPEGAGEVAPPPFRSSGHITFGSFNNLSKVTPDVVKVWSRLLHRVPDARLIVKSTPLADAATRARYHALFTAEGVAPERVELLGRIPTQLGHLDAYGRIDIALDTFPYNGTTTTCEALWMGVPVVSWLGDRHAARVSASILARIGLPGLVAANPDAYVDLAAALAASRDQLAALRAGLRERMRRSPLCDAPGFARQMEGAYRLMWQRWCTVAGAAPATAP